jgi:hypothetical protein
MMIPGRADKKGTLGRAIANYWSPGKWEGEGGSEGKRFLATRPDLNETRPLTGTDRIVMCNEVATTAVNAVFLFWDV